MAVVKPAYCEPLIRNDKQMKYRPFGTTGWDVSALSFGCMRLSDDAELNKKLVSSAIDCGVNYFETTRFYLGGTCQHRTAPGLAGKTAGVIVSGKEGINADKTAYGFRREIDRQLDILGLTHFKFFQVGWFGWDRMSHLLKPGGVLDAVRQAQREGLIQRVGFTGHDSPENFIKCIETGLFDSFTVPYNMINRRYEPLIKRAGELGVGVVAMCPVAGGMLATPSDALKRAIGLDVPTAEMALKFVLSNPNVSTACSGMSTMEQLEQNVRTVGSFVPDESKFGAMCEGLDRLRATLGEQFCTSCRYCMDCPSGVDIPHLMHIYNNWKAFGLADWASEELARTLAEKRADKCNDCGACEKKCPNELPVRTRLKELLKIG
jgi:predicted aldo/keto reductase-like oxidoreductase